MKETVMTRYELKFDGAYNDCHIGCDSCDLYATTHTEYVNGKATAVEVKVSCGNAEQCRHLLEHIKHGTIMMGA